MNFKKGDKLKCIANRGVERYLRSNIVYIAVTDTEPGIFTSDPYITVVNENGDEYSCHARRFEKVD